ncbi:MAG: hypothetical protein ACRDJC_26360, partial [Thermomicrobiales bacterium]
SAAGISMEECRGDRICATIAGAPSTAGSQPGSGARLDSADCLHPMAPDSHPSTSDCAHLRKDMPWTLIASML